MNKTILKVGFWSATLVTIFTIWFTVAFIPYMATLKWVDVETFSSNFKTLSYLAWVIPCLFLALTFPILLASIHAITHESKKLWSLLGLIYGTIYSAVLTTNYWLLATVVRSALEKGYTEGLSWFVIGSPYSVTNTIEGIGYGFMGLATIFAGFAFSGSKLDKWIKNVLIFNGLSGLLGVVFGAFGIVPVMMASLILWCLTFPVATGLLAFWFYRKKKTLNI